MEKYPCITAVKATSQLTRDYEASIAEYTTSPTHILTMADSLADGIITQFPDRFAA